MDPTTLMATRGHGAHAEAEPVLIDHEDNLVVLQLDDGDELRIDRTELRAAIDDAHSRAA